MKITPTQQHGYIKKGSSFSKFSGFNLLSPVFQVKVYYQILVPIVKFLITALVSSWRVLRSKRQTIVESSFCTLNI